MKDKADAKIIFLGTDFTSVNQYIGQTKYEYSDDEVGSCLEDDENKRAILEQFLETVSSKTSDLTVNLDKYSKDKNKLYDDKNGELRYQGLVGVISSPIEYVFDEVEDSKKYRLDITLEIHSRFDIVDGKISKPYFLATMLRQDNYLKTTGNVIEENMDDSLFDFMLIFKFANCLKEAYEKGYYRTYQRFEKNDDRIKGSIDVARHIKENMGLNNAKIAYSYREKTINNYFNHLLLLTYNHIREKFETLFYSLLDLDEIINKMVQYLAYEIQYPAYGIKEIISKNQNSIVHPYYTEYEQLREVCLKILRDEGNSIFDGDGDNVEGILYYIPDLWETFLNNYLMDSDYYMFPQYDKNRIFDFNNNKDFKQSIRPDYVFFADEDKEKPFMILDAKFKPAWAELIENNKWNSYLVEDYNKCIRDMNSFNVHATGIICPSNSEITDDTVAMHNISKYNTTDKFYTFAIYIPLIESKGYEEWENIFAGEIQKTVKKIKDVAIKHRDEKTTSL